MNKFPEGYEIMDNEKNSKNKNLNPINILEKSRNKDQKEYDIVNITQDNNLKNLYEYLKEEVSKMGNFSVDVKKDWFSFKIDGNDINNIVAFTFKKNNNMIIALPFKPKDEKNILNQWKLDKKGYTYHIFIVSNKNVDINKTEGHPNPKKIILEVYKNDNEKTHYKFETEDGEEIPINYIINFIKQSYNRLI